MSSAHSTRLTEADLDTAQAQRLPTPSTARQSAALDRAVQNFIEYADAVYADTLTDTHPALQPSRCQRRHPVVQHSQQLHSFTGWRAVAWVCAGLVVGILSGVVAPWGWL
jgi:hypothetical protein